MQEYDLYRYWEHYARAGILLNCSGHSLRILHTGTLNLRYGPDFTGARFQLDGVTYRGDVELHLTPEDWYRHGHHLDRAYTGVVLHLVGIMKEGLPGNVTHQYLQEPIRTLLLPPVEGEAGAIGAVQRCETAFRHLSHPEAILESLAMQRFQRKVQRFVHDLQHEKKEGLLYLHLMRSLGFRGNETPFVKLARLVPLSSAEQLRGDPLVLYAVFAGQAGFLATVREDELLRLLKKYYKIRSRHLTADAMNAGEWNFAGQRTSNHPHFRLAGWTALLAREGFLAFSARIDDVFMERLVLSSLLARLIQLFCVPVSKYWSVHRSLGTPGKRTGTHYFSENRITEFLINVLLPLHAASANLQGSLGFANYLRDLYLRIPLRGIYPSLLRRFPGIRSYDGCLPGQVTNQALIYLREEFCRTGQCRHCPVVKRKLKKIDKKNKNI